MISAKILTARLSTADKTIHSTLAADHATAVAAHTEMMNQKGANLRWNVEKRQQEERSALQAAFDENPSAELFADKEAMAKRHAQEIAECEALAKAAHESKRAYARIQRQTLTDAITLLLPAAETLLGEYEARDEQDAATLGVPVGVSGATATLYRVVRSMRKELGLIEAATADDYISPLWIFKE